MAREHEPWNWSAGLQPGALNAFLPRRTWRSWSSGLRFMESLLSLVRRHWDHEPTPNPSQEGNGQDADKYLLPSWEGAKVGRFLESIGAPSLRNFSLGSTGDAAGRDRGPPADAGLCRLFRQIRLEPGTGDELGHSEPARRGGVCS